MGVMSALTDITALAVALLVGSVFAQDVLNPIATPSTSSSLGTLFRNGTVSFPPQWLDERRRLQDRWDFADKGWLVPVQFIQALKHGGPTSIGAHTQELIKKGTLIRKSAMIDHTTDQNLMEEALAQYGSHGVSRETPGIFIRLRSYADLERFCQMNDPKTTPQERAALMRYVSDYLFRAKAAFGADGAKNSTLYAEQTPHAEQVFGVWVPGCADNDANVDEVANVEDRLVSELSGGDVQHAEKTYMGMYAMRDIEVGEPLLSDYDGAYGVPPAWAADFARDHLGGWLAFKGHNHKYQVSKKAITGKKVGKAQEL